MSDHSETPTPVMTEFYEQRTRAHIQRVRACLELVANQSVHREELLLRAETHDASKFGPEERVPYIWLTEYHRCRWRNISFQYPPGMEEQVSLAVQHHVAVNRHHPEFHDNPNQMTEVDLIEMVCDWTAMAQEFGEPNGSARCWADKTVGNRLLFNAAKTRHIYEIIGLLEALQSTAVGNQD